MKMTNFFKLALMAVAAITLSMSATSCSDDDDDNGGGLTGTFIVPEKIVVVDTEEKGPITNTYTISYNDALRIASINEKRGDSDYSYKIEYDGEGRISKVTYTWADIIETYTYSYAGYTVTVIKNNNKNSEESKYVYTINAKVTGCVYTQGSFTQNITYTFNADDMLTRRTATTSDQTSTQNITYNNNVAGLASNINMSPLMSVSLAEIDDNLTNLFLGWDKSIEKIEKTSSVHDKEYNTYTYSKTNSQKLPEEYKIAEEELTMTVTYKEITK